MKDPENSRMPTPGLAAAGREARAFRAGLGARLQSGSHLVLYGPRGGGKSTLLQALRNDCVSAGVPCGIAPHTCGLADISDALSQAYPDINLDGLNRRAARVRLRLAADRVAGVLLLDHMTDMTTAMIGLLRRLKGGTAGALLVADIDSERERERIRFWHRVALPVRMPLETDVRLFNLLLSASQAHGVPRLEPHTVRQIVRIARGRIGWIIECARGLQLEQYWRGGRLHLAALCADTEILLRQARPGPRMSRRTRAVSPDAVS